ncbi:kinesin motor protein cin8 [Tulasnella sp. 403]|nr:kinesin motor protein cin8 [Tulasnella sp. 403]
MTDNSPIIVSTRGARSQEITIETALPTSTLGIDNSPPTRTYPFDRVFGPEADQGMIYTDVVHPILDQVLAGYNCLERELEEAQREIGRLRFRIADSPAWEALQNVKDVQIKLLEEQKKELVEQVNALRRILGERVSVWEADASGLGQASPARPGSRKTSGQYTPARSMSMHRSQTAGHGALKDPHLTAGFRDPFYLHGISLTKQLERCRCLKCGRRFDASGLASWTRGGNQSVTSQDSSFTINTSSKSTIAIKATLANMNAELATLKAQRDLLENERQTLEEQARKLNLDVERANSNAQQAAEKVEALRHEKDEGDRLREHSQSERDAAKKLAKEFEEDLVKDRLRLQELESQRSKLAHDMNVISAKLKQKDVEMANVLTHLEKAKQRSRDLEEQLKGTVQSPPGYKMDLARWMLSKRLSINQNIIQQLRQDRENLHQDTEKLKRKLDQVSKDAENLRKQLRCAQTEHENKHHQQEIHLGEMEDYRNDDARPQPSAKRLVP